jgi:peptidoglycan/xylan/chitin deacetylase (PgdA/CDA1 family)
MTKENASTYVFFRNDDVRHSLDQSLIDLTMLCMDHKVPISHAVEPANVTHEVSEWLIGMKKQFPDLIEIIQHGYNHNLKNPTKKMEFGGTRGYQEQYEDIKKGKVIMDEIFGNLWDPIFTFPYGTYNEQTLKAIDQLGYAAISSKVKFNYKGRLKNTVGRILQKDILFDKKINYHPDIRYGYKFKEISVSANIIKQYIGVSTAEHYPLEDILKQIRIASVHTYIIGVLFHHRFHADHLNLIADLITALKDKGYFFSKLGDMV